MNLFAVLGIDTTKFVAGFRAATNESKKLGTEGGKSITQLNYALRKSKAELDTTVKGSKEYFAAVEKYKTLKAPITEHNNLLNDTKNGWGGAAGGVSSFLKGGAVALSIAKITGELKEMLTVTAELDDKLADVRKTTGLNAGEADQLNIALSTINTRSGQVELLGLAKEAGKLGVKGVADVQAFVKEADILNVALGEDLGQGAITQIGKISSIFHNSLLEIGSGINEIGANSKASEAFSVEFLNRMAGTGPVAKLAAGDLLGYSSALENNGQNAEVAGTALNQFFTGFVSQTEKFGKVAGMARGELTKLLQTEGTNSAFLTFLQRLKDGSKSSAEFINKMADLGLDGERAKGIFLTLANSIGMVKEQQAIANNAINAGTSVVTEFNVKNNNLAASLDKSKKAYERLANAALPAMRDLGTVIEKYSTALADALLSETPLTDAIRVQKFEMQGMFDELMNGNIAFDERKKLIDTINSNYADYLPNLISEKDSYYELAGAVEYANSKFEEKMLLNVKEEITQKKLKDIAKAYEEIGRLEKNIAGDKAAGEIEGRSWKIDTARLTIAKLKKEITGIKEDITKTIKGVDDDLKQVISDRAKTWAENTPPVKGLNAFTDLYSSTAASMNTVLEKPTPLTTGELFGGDLTSAEKKGIADTLAWIDYYNELRQIKAQTLSIKQPDFNISGIQQLNAALAATAKNSETSTDGYLKFAQASQAVNAAVANPAVFMANQQLMQLNGTLNVLPAALSTVSNAVTSNYQIIQEQVNATKTMAIDLTQSIHAAFADLTANVASGIGAAIGGGALSFQSFFSGILDQVAGFSEQLGKLLIAQGTAAAIAQTTLLTQPWLAVAAGAALVAAGSAAHALMSKAPAGGKNIPHMAEGGVLTGPRVVLAGERGHEAIVPLHKMPDMVSKIMGTANIGGGGMVVPEIKLRGEDLFLVLKQYGTNNSRRR
jgi:TP901 family phage tail tape measure protein